MIKEALLRLEKNFDGEKYNHTVGAAIKCKNGNIYTGVNCDGIHGSCAEYNISIYLLFGFFTHFIKNCFLCVCIIELRYRSRKDPEHGKYSAAYRSIGIYRRQSH